MKNTLLIALSCTCALVMGCSKSDPVLAAEPDLATKVVGTYKVETVFIPGGSTLTNVSNGAVVIERSGTSLSNVNFTLKYDQTAS